MVDRRRERWKKMRRVRDLGCHLLTSRYQIDDIVRYSVLLDGYGFDHLKVGDHALVTNSSAQYPNAQVLLAAIGALTKRARLSTAVTDPFRRHPVEIAHWVATLDQLTKGRAALGIGAGEFMNIVPYGMEMRKPFTRLREAVEVIKKLWEATPSNPAQYAGEIFSLRNAYLQIRSYQKPHPPLYIGAIRKKTRELAGEIADGWIALSTESPDTMRERVQDIWSGARKQGRGGEIGDSFDVVMTGYTDISDDPEKAYRSVEGAARGGLVWERELLERRTGIKVPEELSVQKMDVTDGSTVQKMNEIMASIPRGLVEEVTLIGKNANDCIHRIEKFLDAGATSVIICNLAQKQEEVFGVYAKEVFPYLRESYGVEGRR